MANNVNDKSLEMQKKIEDIAKHKPRTAGLGASGTPDFDFKQMSLDTKDLDFDDYRSLFPNGESQGIDTISGLSGVDLLMTNGVENIKKAVQDKGDIGPLKDTPLGSLTDNAYMKSANKPYANYMSRNPTAMDYIVGEVRKSKPPESTPRIIHQPGREAARYLDRMKEARGSDLVVPVKQAGEGLDILEDLDYNYDFLNYMNDGELF